MVSDLVQDPIDTVGRQFSEKLSSLLNPGKSPSPTKKPTSKPASVAHSPETVKPGKLAIPEKPGQDIGQEKGKAGQKMSDSASEQTTSTSQPTSNAPPLWAIKTLYFCQSACIASLCRFIVVLYTNLGLSAFWIGVLQFGDPMISFLGGLFWAYVCDQLDQKKIKESQQLSNRSAPPVSNFRIVISTCVILSIVGYVILYGFTIAHGGGKMHDYENPNPNPLSGFSIFLLLSLVLASGFCRSGTSGVLDGLAFTVIEEKNKENRENKENKEKGAEGKKVEKTDDEEAEESYGSQRVWGAVGWGIISLMTGVLVDWFGIIAMFGIYIFFSMLGVVIMWLTFPVKKLSAAPVEDEKVSSSSSSSTEVVAKVADSSEVVAKGKEGKDGEEGKKVEKKEGEEEGEAPQSLAGSLSGASIKLLLSQFDTQWFFLNLIIYGLNMATVDTFLFVYLERAFTPPATKTLLGTTVSVMTLFEIPVFANFDRFRKYLVRTVSQYRKNPGGSESAGLATKILGRATAFMGGDPNRTVMVFCQSIFAFRCFLYAILPADHAALVLFIEPLHGLTYAAMWAASVSYANEKATALNPRLRTTAQALCHGLYTDFGMSFGGIMWGGLITLAIREQHGSDDDNPTPGDYKQGFASCYIAAGLATLTWGGIWILGWGRNCRKEKRAAMVVADGGVAVASSSGSGGLTEPLLAVAAQ